MIWIAFAGYSENNHQYINNNSLLQNAVNSQKSLKINVTILQKREVKQFKVYYLHLVIHIINSWRVNSVYNVLYDNIDKSSVRVRHLWYLFIIYPLGFSEFLSEMVENKRIAIFFISMFLSGVAIYECHIGYKWHLRDCRNNNTCPGTRRRYKLVKVWGSTRSSKEEAALWIN